MASTEAYTLDANILFYALDSSAGAKHRLAVDLVIAASRRTCVMTVQALGEAYFSFWRKHRDQAEEARFLLAEVRETTTVVTATSEDFAEAMTEHERTHMQFWDALLWATARRNGCRVILTEDMQGSDAVGGVRYINPFTAAPRDIAAYRR